MIVRIYVILQYIIFVSDHYTDAAHPGQPGHGHCLGTGHQPHLGNGQKVPQVQAPRQTNGKCGIISEVLGFGQNCSITV